MKKGKFYDTMIELIRDIDYYYKNQKLPPKKITFMGVLRAILALIILILIVIAIFYCRLKIECKTKKVKSNDILFSKTTKNASSRFYSPSRYKSSSSSPPSSPKSPNRPSSPPSPPSPGSVGSFGGHSDGGGNDNGGGGASGGW